MDKFYIRRCVNGKTFVAAKDPEITGLNKSKCPYTGSDFEPPIREVIRNNAEVMGIAFEEVNSGLQQENIYFGKFRITLGETVIME